MKHYYPRGVREEHRSFIEPIVNWLFTNGAHRVDAARISCTCSPEEHYNVSAYTERRDFFSTLANLNLQDLNQENREYKIERTGEYTGGDVYSELQVVHPVRMPLHLLISYLPKDRKEQCEIISEYNKIIL